MSRTSLNGSQLLVLRMAGRPHGTTYFEVENHLRETHGNIGRGGYKHRTLLELRDLRLIERSVELRRSPGAVRGRPGKVYHITHLGRRDKRDGRVPAQDPGDVSTMIYGRDDYDHHGALEAIPSDEPVLLIRSQDKLAIAMMDALITGIKQVNGSDETIRSLLQHRQRMLAWREHHDTKLPDIREPQ